MKQVAIVTGGGRGIGAATARLAAARGYAVAIGYREREEAAQALARELRKDGGEALAVQVDVSVEQQVVELFQHSEAALGDRHGRSHHFADGPDQPGVLQVARTHRAHQGIMVAHRKMVDPCSRAAVRAASTESKT